MNEWWQGFTEKWSWDDPMLLLGVVTVMVTALIPVFISRLGTKQAKRDGELNELQAESLVRQERIVRRQRRDALLEIVDRSSDPTHLGLLWREVREYEGKDREFLLAVFRANVALALPGTSSGVIVHDELTDIAVDDYVRGLERRYAEGERGYWPCPGLLDFLVSAANHGVRIDTSKIVALVTGSTTELQRPSHGFYRELITVLPASAGGLLHRVESIDYRS